MAPHHLDLGGAENVVTGKTFLAFPSIARSVSCRAVGSFRFWWDGLLGRSAFSTIMWSNSCEGLTGMKKILYSSRFAEGGSLTPFAH